jgi:glycolate oxidase FAD binding subunit
MGTHTCLIDGYGPLPLEEPRTVAEVGDLVRAAAGKQQAVYPLGGRTMLGLGAPPAKMGIAVDVRGLAEVIDYPARDMTITVQAGISIRRLQDILAAENQRLPIDVPLAERATLGGILAANVSGPRRYGYGTLRDYVLGISAVNDQGREIKAGGRVVKNVAGYDLCKLFIGSLGTLGILTQATLKLRPRAEEHALISLACAGDSPERLLEVLHGSRTRPVCVDVLNESAARQIYDAGRVAAPATPWVIVVGYEGNGDAVKWQIAQLVRELRDAGRTDCKSVLQQGLDVRLGSTAAGLWRALAEFPACRTGDDGLTFKGVLLPGATAAFCREAGALTPQLSLQAHAGNGIVLGHAGPGLTQGQGEALVQRLRDLAASYRGHVTVLDCPAAWKQSISVWGPPPNDAWLMRQVKEELDPRRLFNPGRFVDGI